MNPTATLTFEKLSCSKGGRLLFRDVDATVSSGNWLYVVGANGVGKTSLLRMVCGLAPVDSGEVRWNGEPIQKRRDLYHQSLCYLGHHNALQESMSVTENLLFSTALSGYSVTETEIQGVLKRFGVGGRSQQLVRHLSQGQKRRVALARLVLSRASLWVLDEPYVAMDEAGVKMLADLVAQHLHDGGLAVLTSHQLVPIGDIPAQLLELRSST